jgi:hypothetical protein
MPSYRKIGGIHFVKLGRLTFMWCVSKRKRVNYHAHNPRTQPLLLTHNV